jgi:uncharacterized protein
MHFEWDAAKALRNEQKHGISFNEARTVFRDVDSITSPDPTHSTDEDRFIDIGYSDRGRLLVVMYTERVNRIRIISLRKATAAERKAYEQK